MGEVGIGKSARQADGNEVEGCVAQGLHEVGIIVFLPQVKGGDEDAAEEDKQHGAAFFVFPVGLEGTVVECGKVAGEVNPSPYGKEHDDRFDDGGVVIGDAVVVCRETAERDG